MDVTRVQFFRARNEITVLTRKALLKVLMMPKTLVHSKSLEHDDNLSRKKNWIKHVFPSSIII